MKKPSGLFLSALTLVCVALLSASPLAAQQSDPFYLSLLEKAQKSFLAKNYEEAARNFEVAAFGLAGNKELQAKAYVYLGLSKYYLKDIAASEKSLRQAAELIGEEGFESLEIYESAWPDLEKLTTFFNLAGAQNDVLPKEVERPRMADPNPDSVPQNPGPKAPEKKPTEKAKPDAKPAAENEKAGQPKPITDIKIDEIKEGDIIPLDFVDTAPQPIKRVPAVYPAYALSQGIEGTVILNALISEKGEVIKTEVVKGIKGAAGFEQASAQAVRQWKFEPASIKGVCVKVWIQVAIEFKKQPAGQT